MRNCRPHAKASAGSKFQKIYIHIGIPLKKIYTPKKKQKVRV